MTTSDKSGDDKDHKDAVEIIKPPHPIKDKVSGSGGPTPEMLAKAQAAIAKMSDDYPGWAMEDVQNLEKLILDTNPGVGNGREQMRDAFKLAHDMRGQGGSFGFPLMTRIANSFCRFIEGLASIDQGALDICMAHVNAMRAILQNNVRGTGGPLGAQIADSLELAVQKYMDKHK
jgi:chemotaxis protein histidine kinase CheA